MPLPYDLVTFAASGTLLQDSDAEEPQPFDDVPAALRTLVNRVALGLIDEGQENWLQNAAVPALGVPVSLVVGTGGGAGADAFLAAAARVRLASERILHISADPDDLAKAHKAGVAVALLERTPVGEVKTPLVHSAADLGTLVDAILAADIPYEWDPSWDALPYPRQYLQGIRFFNSRRYYDAHEVWEEKWQEDKGRRAADFYKGLIQLAVATLHWERGNANGAFALYEEGRGLLAPFAPSHLGLDVLAFLDSMDDYFDPLMKARQRNVPSPAPNTAMAPRIELPDWKG